MFDPRGSRAILKRTHESFVLAESASMSYTCVRMLVGIGSSSFICYVCANIGSGGSELRSATDKLHGVKDDFHLITVELSHERQTSSGHRQILSRHK